MFRHRSKPPSSAGLIAVLFAFLLAVAACSGSPEVEAEDASASEDAETTDNDTSSDEADEVSEDADDSSLEAETDAMGEDTAEAESDVPADNTDEVVADGASTVGGDIADPQLAAALEAGISDRFSLPFMYITVDQDCDGCAETMSLYYVPGEEKASILALNGAYIDGILQSDFSAVDPSLQAGDPRRIAEQLDGTNNTYTIDAVSGAVTSWTIDGNTVTMRCLQVDTRPVDMRTELCENSVIG